MKSRIEECLGHLANSETLAALGAWDGLENQLATAGCALRLMARLYPKGTQGQLPLSPNK